MAATMVGDGIDLRLDRLLAHGFDHVEIELLIRRHVAVFVWRSFDRVNGRSFGGHTLEEALDKALMWVTGDAS